MASQSPNEADWELYQDDLRELYLTKNETLKTVMTTMANNHGFHATKSQYESHFKKWKFTKNSKSQTWIAIQPKLIKRKREGKESDIYVDGVLLPKKKVQKEMSRYAYEASKAHYAQAPSPQTPDGVLICTPGPSEISIFQTDNLPYFQFERLLDSQFQQFQTSTHRVFVDIDDPDIVITTLNDLLKILRRDRFSEADFLTPELSAILPPEISEYIPTTQQISGTNNQGVALQHIKIIIFLLSNNLLETDHFDMSKTILRLLHFGETARLLERLLLLQEPTFESVAENLFRIAVYENDVSVVRILVRTGLDVSHQVCSVDGERLTPLFLAVELGYVDLVRELIRNGANMDPIDAPDSGDSHELLKLAIYSKYDGSSEMIKALLELGVTVNSLDRSEDSALIDAIRKSDLDVVELLLGAGADVNFQTSSGKTALHCAVGIFSDAEKTEDNYEEYILRPKRSTVINLASQSFEIVKVLLKAGAAMDLAIESSDNSLKEIHFPDHDIGETPLDVTVRKGSVKSFRILQNHGAKITDMTLCNAVRANSSYLMGYLIGAGANIDGRSPRGYTALKWAVFYGDISVVKILLGEGANVNNDVQECQGGRLMTALQLASYGGHVKLVRLLLDAGADVNAIPGKHLSHSFTGSALQAAVTLKRYDKKLSVTKMLLKAGATIDVSGSEDVDFVSRCESGNSRPKTTAKPETMPARNPLVVAIENRDVAQINSLLTSRLHVNLSGKFELATSPLRAAAENNDIGLVERLLSLGANANDPRALFTAVRKSADRALVQMLLSARLSILNRGEQVYSCCAALRIAIVYWNLEMIETLLGAGIDNTLMSGEDVFWYYCYFDIRYGESALGTAIRLDTANDLPVIRMLLDAGADPNAIVSEFYGVALSMAIRMKSIHAAELLIQRGADVNSWDGSQYSPLQAAAEIGSLDLVKRLLNAGADVNAPPAEDSGATALQVAAMYGFIGIACLLLEKGAEVNAPPAKKEGRTALEGAAEHGRIDMLQLLLNCGAKVKSSGEVQFNRSLSFARRQGHHAAARLLQAFYDRCA